MNQLATASPSLPAGNWRPTQTFDFSNPELYNPVYIPTFGVKHRFLHYFGSAGSGKSVFAAQKEVALSFHGYRAKRKTIVARRYYNTIENSVYAELKNVIDEWELNDCFKFARSPYSILNTVTGVQFIFLGLDDVEKVKSIRGVDRGWIEEATEMRTRSELDQLSIRLRGYANVQWTLTYNPVNAHHWLNREIHEKRPPDHYIFKTTYRDNIKLLAKDPSYADKLEAYKESNPSFYRVYGLGLWGQNLEGLIYQAGEPAGEMPCLPQAYGLDLGWNDPVALCKIAVLDEFGKDRKQLYAEELVYLSKLDVPSFIAKVNELRISKKIPIVYDPAGSGPLFADALKDAGYWVIAADKSSGSVEGGIANVKKHDIHIVAGSKNMSREIENYLWQNKNGVWTDKPQDGIDHLMDGMRYACTYLSKPPSSGSEQYEEWT